MKLDRLVDTALVVLALCAVIVTGLVVRREFFTQPDGTSGAPIKVSDWQSYASAGQRIGPKDAKVTIVEFSDYQCPFCKTFHETVMALQRKYPRDVSVILRHYPLERIHPSAKPAAMAAECAAEQGGFAAYSDALFEKQDSIGVIGWSEFARRARVPDLERFEACVQEGAYSRRIAEDVASAERLGVRATPTLLINNLRYQGALAEAELEAAILTARDSR